MKISRNSLSSFSIGKKPFADAVLDAFVNQVAAMRDDKEHWVRREASLALGALAKVVSLDVVITSLV